MNIQQAQNMILAGFAFMNREQRKAILKFLKLAKPKLDFNFPNGAPVKEEEPAKPADSLILPSSPVLLVPSKPGTQE